MDEWWQNSSIKVVLFSSYGELAEHMLYNPLQTGNIKNIFQKFIVKQTKYALSEVKLFKNML